MTDTFDPDVPQRLFHRDRLRHRPELWSACDPGGVVASAHYLATAAGADVLRRGGNAVDAAIATSLALGVCESAGSGLGGMATAIVHLAAEGRTVAIPGACRAPRGATPQAVKESHRYRGYRAVAVPMIAAVYHFMIERYGTMSPSDLVAPAVTMAEEGVAVTPLQRVLMIEHLRTLQKRNAAPFFLDPDGAPPDVGTIRRQPILARTLQRLGNYGFEEFYLGETAEAIVEDMRRADGFIDRRDLTDALTVQEEDPLLGRLDGEPVATLGPPAGGLALLQMLQMAGERPPEDTDLRTHGGVRLVASIIRRVRVDRRRFRLRTGAEDAGEAAVLLEEARIVEAMKEVAAELESTPVVGNGSADSGETSHIVVMDRSGTVVSMTQSIERSFGAGVVTPSLGFLHNGYLRAFKVRNERHPHYLRPGAKARSNAAPTIAFRNGAPWAALGSTGSERMASGILEVLLRLRCGESPFEAVHGPRLHCTPEKRVLLEENRFPDGTRAHLRRHGFAVEALESYSFKMGGLQLVVSSERGPCGVGEPRRDGAAAGPSSLDP